MFHTVIIIIQVFLFCISAVRLEEMVVDKLDKKKRERQTNTEYLGQTMIDAGNEFGPGTPYGKC